MLEALKDGKIRMTCSTLGGGEMLGLRREGTFWWQPHGLDEDVTLRVTVTRNATHRYP